MKISPNFIWWYLSLITDKSLKELTRLWHYVLPYTTLIFLGKPTLYQTGQVVWWFQTFADSHKKHKGAIGNRHLYKKFNTQLSVKWQRQSETTYTDLVQKKIWLQRYWSEIYQPHNLMATIFIYIIWNGTPKIHVAYIAL